MSKSGPLLCCPVTRQELLMASEDLLQRLNRKIQSQSLKNKSGQLIDQAITEALINFDQTHLYPIRQGIPLLLAEESILVSES